MWWCSISIVTIPTKAVEDRRPQISKYDLYPESVWTLESSWTPNPDNLQNLTGTSLSKDISVTKFSWTSGQFFLDIWHMLNLLKNALSCNIEESSKNSWIWIQKRITFQHLITSSLSIDTFLVKFSWRSTLYSFYVKLLTDRQTDNRRVKHW